MLQIKNISKQYKTGDLVQNALNDVSLNFRDNEFVSILGPSGSGKTTLLNIIGGLDRYDSGDLIINNVSTKKYKDRDWDSYRNHTIGFVFQSYNLIPHQTVLSNVELALTIGGISKKERKERALQALDEVGLKEQAHKRPNQMSGGQMQRVAIARALVNNPKILLADEPTGALDTETSVQVMELLKKVAKDRLVIMVTHNPELAEEYSTRIVRLKDGKIIGDTDAFEPENISKEPPRHRNLGKASMSWFTAFSLSFNNLLTKKGRTILTSFAGSIGIIGIALILSLSTGFQNYIDQIQEDTLTSYPLTLSSETADVSSALLSMAANDGEEEDDGAVVKERRYIASMFTKIGTNNLRAFKSYLEEHQEEVDDMVSLISYKYSVKPQIYTVNASDKVTRLNPSSIMTTLSGGMMSSTASSVGGSNIFYEMMDDKETLEEQYEVLAGRVPESYNELLLVLPEKNGIPDLLMYGLGLREEKELEDMMAKIAEDEKVEDIGEAKEYTYEELLNIPLKLIDASATYEYNEKYDIYEDMSEDEDFMKKVYDEATNLKIVGVVCAKEGESSMNLSTGVAYTKELTQYVLETASESEIVKKQLEDREVNVFSNKRFDDKTEEAGIDFEDMISVDTEMLSSAFGVNISESDVAKMTEGYMESMTSQISQKTVLAAQEVNNNLATFATQILESYIERQNGTNEAGQNGSEVPNEELETVMNVYLESEEAQQIIKQLEEQFHLTQEEAVQMYKTLLESMIDGYLDQIISGSTGVTLTKEMVQPLVESFMAQESVQSAVQVYAAGMIQNDMQQIITVTMPQMMAELMNKMANSFQVDQSKIVGAFQFNMGEEELMRLMETMSAATVEQTADTNLQALGYQNIEKPSSISFYFKDFDAKEEFIDFLDAYNDKMEKEDEERVLKYTDITGLLMSSVKTIVDSVSYVLIAFVSISLVVSSIMIGIITYISVFERTKEIGILRAIGASKRNISSIFNAETFIVGLFAGLIGIGVTLALIGPINTIIHNVSGNTQINAALPVVGGTILVILSVILTLIGGFIPSKQAAKKDPVLALRSE